jgi:pyruvate formate lyase activating enzyme
LAEIKFAGILKQSLVDYPGKVAAVLFTRGCNICCPFCHNVHLVIKPHDPPPALELEDALTFLIRHTGFLDAVVVSGGEPTLHKGLPKAFETFKALGYYTKLDTNGTDPAMLKLLLDKNLLDYVAMDVKAPLEYKKYAQAVGGISSADFFNVRSSINLLRSSPIQVEFRTTVVPSLHTDQDIVDIARYLKGCHQYTLQQFNPSVTLEPGFGNVTPYRREEMQRIAALCSKYVENLKIVNL